ncbi:transposase, partial [bacterium]|nr:transposase [bacterium]
MPNIIKKEISRKVLEEVTADYDFKHDITTPDEDLLGINNQLPVSGIINLDKMAEYINEITCSRIIKFSNYDRSAIYIKDEELQFIDQLIDDTIINNLLSGDSYSPSMREIFPSHLFRAELLKALKYPEISYRKFC